MEVRFHWFVITIVNVVVMIGYVTSDVHSLKCSDNDPRDVYDGCMLDYRDMALWCDRTNLTCVPDPKTIRSQAPCQRAVYLYMNDSCLSHIEAEMLEKYVSLEVADFSQNLLINITNQTFISTNHMTLLDLSENMISDIEEDAFVAVYKLKEMILYKNRLSHLKPGVFKNMTSLSKIDLSSNHLDKLDWSWFASEVNLQILNVTGNKISFLQQPLAGQVKYMKELDFSDNKLQKLNKRNFNYMQMLRHLYIRRNQLTIIDADTFEHTPNLVTIDLRDNKLHSLPNNLFRDLCYLQQLLLSGNSLLSVSSDWLANVVRNNYYRPTNDLPVALSDNAWSCDCNMLSYWELLQTMKNSSFDPDANTFDITCNTPETLQGHNLTKISREQLTSSGDCAETTIPSTNTTNNTSVINIENSSDQVHLRTAIASLLSQKCLLTKFPSTSQKIGTTTILMYNKTTTFNRKNDESNSFVIIIIVTISLFVLFCLGIILIYWVLRNNGKRKLYKNQAFPINEEIRSSREEKTLCDDTEKMLV